MKETIVTIPINDLFAPKCGCPACNSFLLQKDEVELRAVEQIVDREQTAALAYLLKYVLANVADGSKAPERFDFGDASSRDHR